MNARPGTLDRRVQVALWVVILGYPLLRLVLPYLDSEPVLATRAHWWLLWGGLLLGHWVCFGICAFALAHEPTGWRAIGLDWGWFSKRKFWWVITFGAMALAAVVMPGVLYGGETPDVMRTHPLGPVTASERLFWIAIAVTAGVVEELVYRGFAITYLRRAFNLSVAVVFATLAFVFIHGPSALQLPYFALYVVAALLFTAIYASLKFQRLHVLIVIHVLADISLVAAP